MTNETQGAKYWRERKANDPYMDWRTGSDNWIKEYWESKNHPHRKQIIRELKKLEPWALLVELGSNCGVNLALISENFDKKSLLGFDINNEAVKFGNANLGGKAFILKQNIEEEFAFADDVFDCAIIDAALMYISDKNIEKVIKEIDRVTKKAIILCEWFDENRLGVLNGGHWSRNYPKLLKNLGWKVKNKKINWPTSEKWQKYGRLFIATK